MKTKECKYVNQDKICLFRQGTLSFWENNGRKHLPWRKTKDPWNILLAEILLRKTTSKQAIGVYQYLCEKSLKEIKLMNQSNIEKILYPLGISRIKAQQIKLTAEAVYESGKSSLYDISFIKQLPGAGKYTVNTVLCFSMEYPKPALDTNMIRIITRVFNYKTLYSRAREDKYLWCLAEQLVPLKECREFNWGILDLGALVCMIKTPKCEICPLINICIFSNKSFY